MASSHLSKIALVTGASRGIGQSIAQELAAADFKVYINYCYSPDGAKTVAEKINHDGGMAVPIRCDVSQPEDVTRMIRSIREESGRIDVLVNNAGIT
ncbi:MAG: SDR family NAD(P)-dependent oxidoreductase, partial [Desulfobacteraceae bacterium]